MTRSLFGHPIDACGAHVEVRAWLGVEWGLNALLAPTRDPIIVTTVETPVPWRADRPHQTLALHGHQPICQLFEETDGTGFCLRNGTAWLESSQTHGRVAIRTHGPLPDLVPLLNVAFSEVLRIDGYLSLHAAAWRRNGVADVVLARSGTGKSTTLLTAARSGLEPLAEDWVWLDPARGELVGWDRTLRLWPDSYARFAAFLPPGAPRAGDGKVVVPFAALGTAPTGPTRLGRMVLLARDLDAPSAWGDVDQLQKVHAVWEACGVPVTSVGRRATQAGIERLLRDPAVAWRGLRIGHTPLSF